MAFCKFVGDRSILVKFEEEISWEVNEKVRGLNFMLQESSLPEIVDIIPAYCSLLIIYDPFTTDRENLLKKVQRLTEDIKTIELPKPREITIPVKYGDEEGPDLEFVADYNDLTIKEVIDIYSTAEYRVFMLGFTPGFPYLGGMSKKISTPRLKEPRKSIPGGSVGIAGEQTGIYPISSPGGWRIIGKTPLNLFDVEKDPAFLLSVGDIIKFTSVKKEKYEEIKNKVNFGEFEAEITRR